MAALGANATAICQSASPSSMSSRDRTSGSDWPISCATAVRGGRRRSVPSASSGTVEARATAGPTAVRHAKSTLAGVVGCSLTSSIRAQEDALKRDHRKTKAGPKVQGPKVQVKGRASWTQRGRGPGPRDDQASPGRTGPPRVSPGPRDRRVSFRTDKDQSGPTSISLSSDPVQLVLASASPRRADLLTAAGLPFMVQPVAVDESRLAGESPDDYVRRLARTKARGGRGQPGRGRPRSRHRRRSRGRRPRQAGKCGRGGRHAAAPVGPRRTRCSPASRSCGGPTSSPTWRRRRSSSTRSPTPKSRGTWPAESTRTRRAPMPFRGSRPASSHAIEGSYTNVVGLPVDLVYRHIKAGRRCLRADDCSRAGSIAETESHNVPAMSAQDGQGQPHDIVLVAAFGGLFWSTLSEGTEYYKHVDEVMSRRISGTASACSCTATSSRGRS